MSAGRFKPCAHVERSDRKAVAFKLCDECYEAAKPYIVAVERAGKTEVLYVPQLHQARFHGTERLNCLMEGGRGSGKSIAMRWDAYMRCLKTPRFRALVVRRSMPELKQSHLNEVPFEVERLGFPKESWHATDFVLRFPNGSSLRFGHVEDDSTLARYLSSEFERIYFDELATFTLRQFLFLCSSLRSPIEGYVPGAGGGTNPVGPGATWVKRWFIDRNPGEDEAPGYNPEDYETIHSTMDDNPYIDRVSYDKILNAMPSDALRRALRHGEWVIEGQAFSEWREKTPEGKPWHVFDHPPMLNGKPIWEHEHIKVVRVVDWGYAPTGNPGVCLWFALMPDHSALCFREYVFKETLPKDAAAEIRAMSAGLRVTYTVGDTAMWQEHEGPSIAEMFSRAKVSMQEADKNRVAGWVQLHSWLRGTVNDGVIERPRLSFYREGCPHTIRTLPTMLVDPKNPGDIVTVGVEDDPADCCRYFAQSRPGRSYDPAQTPAQSWVRRQMARKEHARDVIGSEATRVA